MEAFWVRPNRAEVRSFMFPVDKDLFRRASELDEEALLLLGRQVRGLPYLFEEDVWLWCDGGFEPSVADAGALLTRTIESLRSVFAATRGDHSQIFQLVFRREEVQRVWEALYFLPLKSSPSSADIGEYFERLADDNTRWQPWRDALEQIDREICDALDVGALIWAAPLPTGWEPNRLFFALAFDSPRDPKGWWEDAHGTVASRWCFDPARLATLSEQERGDLMQPLLWSVLPKEVYRNLPDDLKERHLSIREAMSEMGDAPGSRGRPIKY